MQLPVPSVQPGTLAPALHCPRPELFLLGAGSEGAAGDLGHLPHTLLFPRLGNNSGCTRSQSNAHRAWPASCRAQAQSLEASSGKTRGSPPRNSRDWSQPPRQAWPSVHCLGQMQPAEPLIPPAPCPSPAGPGVCVCPAVTWRGRPRGGVAPGSFPGHSRTEAAGVTPWLPGTHSSRSLPAASPVPRLGEVGRQWVALPQGPSLDKGKETGHQTRDNEQKPRTPHPTTGLHPPVLVQQVIPNPPRKAGPGGPEKPTDQACCQQGRLRPSWPGCHHSRRGSPVFLCPRPPPSLS